MFFSVTELERRPVLFEVEYKPGEIDYGEGLRQTGVLKVNGKAELLPHTLGEIRLRGHVDVMMESECDRCLEPAALPVDTDFDLFFRPTPLVGKQHPEVHLEEGEIEISFYEGDGVALREALREFILLARPMQLFCQEQCPGLCPKCGANRKHIDCGCKLEPSASRWVALKNLE
jgi:uncharacterized protein